MTVYVDDMRRPARVGGVWGHWSHLLADTPEELREFAGRLGLSPGWVQDPGTHREHYDVTDSVRKRALRLSAEPISYPRGAADLLARRHAERAARRLDAGGTRSAP